MLWTTKQMLFQKCLWVTGKNRTVLVLVCLGSVTCTAGLMNRFLEIIMAQTESSGGENKI